MREKKRTQTDFFSFFFFFVKGATSTSSSHFPLLTFWPIAVRAAPYPCDAWLVTPLAGNCHSHLIRFPPNENVSASLGQRWKFPLCCVAGAPREPSPGGFAYKCRGDEGSEQGGWVVGQGKWVEEWEDYSRVPILLDLRRFNWVMWKCFFFFACISMKSRFGDFLLTLPSQHFWGGVSLACTRRALVASWEMLWSEAHHNSPLLEMRPWVHRHLRCHFRNFPCPGMWFQKLLLYITE